MKSTKKLVTKRLEDHFEIFLSLIFLVKSAVSPRGTEQQDRMLAKQSPSSTTLDRCLTAIQTMLVNPPMPAP